MPNRQAAQAAVAQGRVLVAGAVADKPARLVSAGDPLTLAGAGPPFVSRGGEKLEAALLRFEVAVEGTLALDAGASTGGFTDCLLQHGARQVVSLDVGHGQLDSRLRQDRRVVVVERTNVRHLTPAVLAARAGGVGGPFDVVTADLSFISLATVAPVLAGTLARPGADLVLLVKPQFEAGRAEASRGRGVVRNPVVWRQALEGVSGALGAAGAAIMGAMRSPIVGASGNVEFFLHAHAHTHTGAVDEADAFFGAALAED